MQRRDFLRTSLGLIAAASTVQLSPGANVAKPRKDRALFFTAEHLARLRARLEHDPDLRARWTTLMARADELLRAPLVSFEEANIGTGGNASFPRASRQLVEMAFVLGLAWRITGGEQYAKTLSRAMQNSLRFLRWSSPGMLSRKPPWNSDLWTAAFTVGCAAGCDALDDYLSIDERQDIHSGMTRLGIEPLLRDWVLPETRMHALDSMGHNWWSVCVSGAGIGLLAVLDDNEHADGWLDEVDTALAGFFQYQGHVLHNKPANFDPAGAFYESVSYAEYALCEYLLFRMARMNVLATAPAPMPLLDRAGEFFVHALYPASAGDMSVDFGDSYLRSNGVRSMRLLAALGHDRELALWYLRRHGDQSADPLALLCLDASAVLSANTLPTSIAYHGIGWAMLRTGWEEDATLLAVRCGDSWNHAHADAGSFVLYHAGRPLLIDSGTCSYSRREYIDYYVSSRAHNVVLFNDEGQPREDVHERGAKFPGKIRDLIDGAGLKYLYADATGPMSPHFSRNYRHWLWVGGAILIFDDILAHQAGRFDWLLHYAGEARLTNARVDVVNGPALARVTMLFPPEPVVREKAGLAPGRPDEPTTYLAFSPPEPAREQKFLVAIVPQPVDRAADVPQVELLREPGVVGARVRTRTEVTDVYLNLEADGRRMHFNSHQSIAGWDTDAYMLGLTRSVDEATANPENVSRYFVVFGSYLRHRGVAILDCFSKFTAVHRPGVDAEVVVHSQPGAELSFFVGARPRSLRVNGAETEFAYDASKSAISFVRQGRDSGHETP